MFRDFIYYGHSKDIYEDVSSQREYINQKQTEILTTLFLIVMILASFLSLFGPIARAHRFIYFSYVGITLVFGAILFVFNKFVSRHTTIFMYIAYALPISFAIITSKMDPFQIGVVFPSVILVMSVVLIDNMLRYSIVAIASFVCYWLVSYYTKPPSVAQTDLMLGIIFVAIALIFHYRFQHNRLEQFLNFFKIQEIQRDLIVQSSFDVLSGLLVRGRFFSLAGAVMRERVDDEFVALCILDLDSFKQINDKYGHQMGDKAIQTAAQIIWETLEIDYTEKWSFCERAAQEGLSFAGRLGGDEFVIFFRENQGMDAVKASLQKILDKLNAVKLGELDGICASFGVAEIRNDDYDIDSVYARADDALYEAKSSGKNRIVVSE